MGYSKTFFIPQSEGVKMKESKREILTFSLNTLDHG